MRSFHMLGVHSHHAICEECNNCALCLKCTCEGTELLNKALSKLKVKEGNVTPSIEKTCDCGVTYKGGAKSMPGRRNGMANPRKRTTSVEETELHK